jgi:hypothetical protein
LKKPDYKPVAVGSVAAASRPAALPDATTELPPISFEVPETLADCLDHGPSWFGHSAVSEFLQCPERSRLRAAGVRPKPIGQVVGPAELDALGIGVVLHALRAIRYVHGMAAAIDALQRWHVGMTGEDALKIFTLLRLYDERWPLAEEPFTVLGIEVTVFSAVVGPAGPVIRSVRYDGVVRDRSSGAVMSHEFKTSSRKGGMSTLNPYRAQIYSQCMIWNANPDLVRLYGPMEYVIGDIAIKTDVPSFERVGPMFINSHQQELARRYMTLPEATRYPVMPDGSYPPMLHSCYGRWRPCEFLSGCHDGAWGSYTFQEGA